MCVCVLNCNALPQFKIHQKALTVGLCLDLMHENSLGDVLTELWKDPKEEEMDNEMNEREREGKDENHPSLRNNA